MIEDCAELAERLLGASRGLRVLATSREVLGVSGERVFRVGGLALPGPGQDPRESEAVQLFVERAAATHAGFVPAPADLDAVVRSSLPAVSDASDLSQLAPDRHSPRQWVTCLPSAPIVASIR